LEVKPDDETRRGDDRDDLDFDAEFQSMTEEPDLHAAEMKAQAAVGGVAIWMKPSGITARVEDDKAYIAMAMPLESMQDLVLAFAHIRDHACRPASEWVTGMVTAITAECHEALEERGLLPDVDNFHEGEEGSNSAG
jgi:hypothetical protein